MAVCYIVGAGNFDTEFTPEKEDFVIAADGGYDHLIQHGIRCDLLIGDFDSIEKIPASIEILRFPPQKDYTDMFLAYLEGVKRGYSDFSIHGGMGGREDHTFANYSLLLYAKENSHTAVLESKNTKAFVIKDEEISLKGEKGKGISIFAFGNDAKGVTLQGLFYSADNITLKSDFPLGVSNCFDKDTAKISVKSGVLLIIREI